MNLADKLEIKFRLSEMEKKSLRKLDIFSVHDILFHFPTRYSDLSVVKRIAELSPGETATVYGKVSNLKTKKGFRSKIPMGDPFKKFRVAPSNSSRGEATITDLSGKIKITWFHQAYLAKMIKEGESVKLTGKVTQGKSGIYLANPEFEKAPDMPIDSHESLFKDPDVQRLESGRWTSGISYPVYPETRGITSKWFYHAIERILKEKTLDSVEDYVPADILKKYNLPSLKTALI